MPRDETLIDYYRKTHANGLYGNTSVKYIRYLRPWITLQNPRSILDYGCGQSVFLDALDLDPSVQRWRYDPAIEQFAQKPNEIADLVINIDVLEHIEEDQLDPILDDIRQAGREAILIIDTVPSVRCFDDGRNIHRTIKPASWWREKLLTKFDVIEPIKTTRRSRAGFKTWSSPLSEKAAFQLLHARENAIYYANRLIGRGKRYDFSSTIHQSPAHHDNDATPA